MKTTLFTIKKLILQSTEGSCQLKYKNYPQHHFHSNKCIFHSMILKFYMLIDNGHTSISCKVTLKQKIILICLNLPLMPGENARRLIYKNYPQHRFHSNKRIFHSMILKFYMLIDNGHTSISCKVTLKQKIILICLNLPLMPGENARRLICKNFHAVPFSI